MKILNPFKLQNWKFKKFLVVILFFQISLLGLFIFNNLGIDTFIIRPLIGFIYLTFIPGYLLLRILKLHNLDTIESLLYAVGLSLFLDMVVGFLINMLYPILGITGRPITEIPIVLTMILVVGILSIVAYIRDKDYENPDYISLKDIINPQVLFLSLIPFMAIFGTYLVNYYDNNILLMVMIIVIVLVSLIVGFTNWINEKYFPYALWVIAISLILHQQLISQTIIINDCVGEFYYAKNVISLGYWPWYEYAEDISNLFPSTYNSVLSVTVLPAVFHYITHISLNWIYKLILPLFYSLLPLSLYISFKYITNNKKLLFLSTFLFISTTGFLKIPTITKQLLAQLYVLLLIITFLNPKIKSHTRMLLLSIFSFSLVVSHYTTTYLVIPSIVFILLFFKVWKWIFPLRNNIMEKELTIVLGILVIFAISWYMYTSQSISFKSFLDFIQSLWTYEVFDIYESRLLYTVTVKLSSGITDHIIKFLYMVLSFFIFIGYVDRLNSGTIKKDLTTGRYIFILGFGGFLLLLLILAIVLPSITSSFDTVRLYQTSLLILSIFAIFGIKKFVDILNTILKKLMWDISLDYIKLSSIFVILLLIFPGTSLVSEIINDNPRSISLSKEKILNSGSIKFKISYFQRVIPTENIISGKWIGKYGDSNDIYRFDVVQGYPSLLLYGDVKGKVYSVAEGRILDNGTVEVYYDLPKDNTIMQLTYQNLVYGLYWTWYNPLQTYILYNRSDVKPIIVNSSKIYDNGKSQVLWYN